MSDYIVRATAAEDSIRAFAIDAREIAETARRHHNTSPVMTAAMGRLLAGGAMMGSMMKGDTDLLTLQIRCGGPAKGLIVTADASGRVKGYPMNSRVDLPPNSKGHLDVGGALGPGVLSVIRDLGLKEPYVGQCRLQTGEIAEDLTYYFATSEQIPSAVGLGVLVNPDGSVKQAGGFIIQLMPFTPEEVIAGLEEKLAHVSAVTDMQERGMAPEQILEELLGDFGLRINDRIPAEFYCDCSKEKISRALATISRDEMDGIIRDGQSIDVRCDFCNTGYQFTVDELKAIRLLSETDEREADRDCS